MQIIALSMMDDFIFDGLEGKKAKKLDANFVSKLASKGGGAEGGRTPVRRPEDQSFSERSLCFDIPSAGLPQTGFAVLVAS